MPPPRRRPATLAQRLHAAARRLGVPPDVAARAVAYATDTPTYPRVEDYELSDEEAADFAVLVRDDTLWSRLAELAADVGVPVPVLVSLIVSSGLERWEARERGQRWASDAAGPSRRAAGRAGRSRRR